MPSPTQRSIRYLREQGYAVAVVERYIAQIRRRLDLFGFADLLAINPDHIVAVQVTVDDRRADHRAKILAEPHAALFVAAGGRIELHTWGRHGERGKRKLWRLHREQITPATNRPERPIGPEQAEGGDFRSSDNTVSEGRQTVRRARPPLAGREEG